MRSFAPHLAFLALAGGCSLGEVPLSGKRCPCAAGWVCDEARNLCVETGPRLDAGTGTDAGPNRDASDARDAGPRDAGPDGTVPVDAGRDAGPDAGPVDGCLGMPADVIFCDGFEDPALSAWPVRFGDDPVGRVTDRVHAGVGALHALGAPGDILGVEVRGLPDPGADLFIRAWVYVEDHPPARNFQFLFVGEAAAPYNGVGFGINSSGYPYVYANTVMAGFTSSIPVPAGRWVCLGAHIAVSDADGALEVLVDGVSGHVTTGIDTRAAAPYTQLGAGITWSYPMGVDADVWVDDVAIARSAIPCE